MHFVYEYCHFCLSAELKAGYSEGLDVSKDLLELGPFSPIRYEMHNVSLLSNCFLTISNNYILGVRCYKTVKH